MAGEVTRLVFQPDGKYLYVLIGNPYTEQGIRHGQIAVFRRTASGSLVPVPGARLHDLPAPLSLAFTPDGKFAYLLLGGTSELGNSGYIRIYRVGADGSLKLSPTQPQPSQGRFAYDNPDTVLISPNGRYAYISSTAALDEYAIHTDGSLEQVFSLPGPTSYPVIARNGSLLFALRRIPDAEHQPGFSPLLMAIRVDPLGHLTQTTYLISADGFSADGSLQKNGVYSPSDWSQLGFAYQLQPSEDGKFLYSLDPRLHDGVSVYSVSNPDASLSLIQKFSLPVDPQSRGFPVAMTAVAAPKEGR